MALAPTTNVRIVISATADQANRAFDRLDRALARPRVNMEKFNLQFRRLDRIWTLLAVGSGAALIKTFVGMAAELQKTQLQLAAFTRDLSTVPEVMDKIIALTDKVPFSLNTMTNSFVRLRAAGIEPIVDQQGNGPLKDLADAVAAFGGGDEIFKRATIALQQMAGKGVISMEELRQQLGEAIPTAMRIMAEQMGISVSKLINDVSRGLIEFEEGSTALFDGFREKFGGAGELLKTTFTGQLQQTRLEFEKLSKILLLDSGAMDVLTSALTMFNKALRDFGAFLKSDAGVAAVDAFWAGVERVAIFAAQASGPLLNLVSIISDLGGALFGIGSGLPPEVVGGGILGFVLFGKAGVIPGALLGLFSDQLAAIAGGIASFVSGLMGLLDSVGVNAGNLAAGGLLGFMIFGPVGGLIGMSISVLNDVFSNVKKGIAVIMLYFEEGLANLNAQFQAGVANPLDIIFNHSEIKQKGEAAGLATRKAFLEKLTKGDTFLGDVNANLFESLGITENAQGKGDKAAAGIKKFFDAVKGGVQPIQDARERLVSMFQAINDIGGLTPPQLAVVSKLGSTMERLREQAEGGGNAIGRFKASIQTDLAKVDDVIAQVSKRIDEMGEGDTRVAGLKMELKSLVAMRGDMQQLGDTIVKNMSDKAFEGIENRIGRLTGQLDKFIQTGKGMDLMEAETSKVEARFDGLQASLTKLINETKRKTDVDDKQKQVLGTLQGLQDKLNEGLKQELERTTALVNAKIALNNQRAIAAASAAEGELAVLNMENNFDKVGLAVARAEVQVQGMRDNAAKAIEAVKKQLAEGVIDPKVAQETLDRWAEVQVRIEEQGDAMIERMRFNASDFGTLMNTVAQSMEDSLASGIENLVTKTKTAKEVLQDFYADITRAVAKYLAQQALVGIFGGSQTGSQGGLGGILGQGIASIFGGGLLGFAQGGSMVLGGHGGTDNNVLSMNGEPVARVSRGETMTIDPVGASGRGETTNININAVDAASVRELFMREGSALVGSMNARQRLNRA